MKKSKMILALSLTLGSLIFADGVSANERETVLHNKNGLVLKLRGDNKGVFKVYVKNETANDMFNVSLMSEDIKGFKLVEGRTLVIGDIKAGEEKTLDEKVIKYELEKIVEEAIKNNKLAKTGINGVYKIYIPIAICGMIGMAYVVVTNKKNRNKILSLALATTMLTGLGINEVKASTKLSKELSVSGRVMINDKEYEYAGLLMWNEEKHTKVPSDYPTEEPKEDKHVNIPGDYPTEEPKEEVHVKVPDNFPTENPMPEKSDKVVNFKDPELKKFILDKLKAYDGNNTEGFSMVDTTYRKDDSDEIYELDLENLEKLNLDLEARYEADLWETMFTSLEGLESATNLKQLILSNNNLTDVKPLEKLEKLEILKLDYNNIEDVSPLSKLNNLMELDLSSNKLNSIDPIGEVTSLRKLIISNPHVEEGEDREVKRLTDISALSKLENLEFLRLSHNDITDVTPLNKLSNLENLFISHNLIENINPLSELTNLKYLDFAKNKVKDIEAIRNLVNLENLSMTGGKGDHGNVTNEITNLDAVKDLTNINWLWSGHNKISDVTPLEKLTKLENLNLEHNDIEVAEVLKDLTAVTTLDLSDNKISNLDFIKTMTLVKELDLKNNGISNIDSLSELAKVENLYLAGNEIENLDALKDLTTAKILDLSNNKISDISALEKLSNVYDLNLSNNDISDISKLESLTGLNSLNLSANNIKDFSVLEKLTGVYDKTLGNQEVPGTTIESETNTFELVNPFVALEKVNEGAPTVTASNEKVTVEFNKEENKFVINYTGDFTEDKTDITLTYNGENFVIKDVTLKKKVFEISNIEFVKTTLENNETVSSGKVYGKNLQDMNIFVFEVLNGTETKTEAVTFTNTGKSGFRDVSFTFPENTTNEDKVYKAYFGKDENSKDKFVEFTVKHKELKNVDILKLNFKKLTVEVGETTIFGTILGSDVTGVEIFPFEVVSGQENPTTDVTMKENLNTGTRSAVELTFKENQTTEDKTYKIYFGRGEALQDKFIEVVVKGKPAPQNPVLVTFLKFDDKIVEQGTTSVSGRVFGKNLENVKIFPKEIVNEVEVPTTDVNLELVTTTAKNADIKLNFVENTTENDKTYRIYFGGDTPSSEYVDIVVNKKENTTPIIPPVTPPVVEKPEILDSSYTDNIIENIDDTATVRVLGLKLTNDVKIFAKEVVDGKEIDSDDIILDTVVGNRASNKTLFLKTKKVYSEDKMYNVYFGYDGPTKVFQTITVKGDPNAVESPNPGNPTPTEETFKFVNAFYKTDGKTFRIEFEEELKSENLADLKSKIKFVTDGNKRDLTTNDLVVVSGKNINIILDQPIGAFDILFTRLEMSKGAVKSVSNKISEEVNSPFTKEAVKENITGYDINKYILESVGGSVRITFKGENLTESSAKVRIIDVESRLPLESVNQKVKYVKSGNDLIAIFKLPENTGTNAKSYRVSMTNSSNQPITESTEVITVLAPGQSPTEPAFSTIDIRSYQNNQSIGSGELNVKHTEVSEGQQSKKTRGNIYGANLDFRKMDIVITDDTGKTWELTPSSVDGPDQYFKYLGGNPTTTVKMRMEGVTVFYEIILPNNLTEDRTFTYQFKINGQIIEGAKVTAFIKKAQ